MKIRIALLCCMLGIGGLSAQSFSDTLYGYRRENDVYFGSAVNYAGNEIPLYLDLYKPVGDGRTDRPLLVLVHGGAWIGGSKSDADIQALAPWFARFGYVVASVSYRLGFHPSMGGGNGLACPTYSAESNCVYPADSAEILRAHYRAVQDVKGAVRFMKARAAEDSVCLDRVFLGGISAGGFNALAAAFLDDPSEKPSVAAALPDAPGPSNPLGYCHDYFNVPGAPISRARPDLGDIEGSIALNGYDTHVKGVANYFGGMLLPLFLHMEAEVPSVYFFHQTNDVIVSCGYGRLLSELSYGCLDPLGFLGCTHVWNTPLSYGSCAMMDVIDAQNLNLNYYNDVRDVGPPNCLANPPGHSLLSGYQQAHSAAVYFGLQMDAAASGCLSTSFSAPLLSRSLEVFPNPIAETFYLKNQESYSVILVVDMQGCIRCRYDASASDKGISVSQLPPGVYRCMAYHTEQKRWQYTLISAIPK